MLDGTRGGSSFSPFSATIYPQGVDRVEDLLLGRETHKETLVSRITVG